VLLLVALIGLLFGSLSVLLRWQQRSAVAA
jgi:LPS O-antigen subunit length determinant protein (WzzB/FepE family)